MGFISRLFKKTKVVEEVEEVKEPVEKKEPAPFNHNKRFSVIC